MQAAKTSILKSTDLLNDSFFENAVIFIAENNQKGAVGFVINKRFGKRLNELEEFKHSPVFPLYDGGPVDREHLFFIHRRPDLINDGTEISDNIFFSGDFKQAITSINNKSITEKDIKIFIGYCGWDEGELESEIKEGSWELIDEFDIF